MSHPYSVKDNLVPKEKIIEIYKFCRSRSYYRTEFDGPNLPYTGLLSNLEINDNIVKYLLEVTKLSEKKLYRAYINLFLPDEKPNIHQDKKGDEPETTLLYYVNTEPNNADDLGETFFYFNNEVRGVQPVPGRITVFDGDILHRASALRNIDRFTIALKFNDNMENILNESPLRRK